MKTKDNKKIKIGNPSGFVAAIVCIIVILSFFTFMGYSIIYNATRPAHKIKVTYTVYSNPARQESGIYKIRGSNFVSSVSPLNGAVRLYVKDGKSRFIMTASQSICVYTGLNDVKVNKIEILE